MDDDLKFASLRVTVIVCCFFLVAKTEELELYGFTLFFSWMVVSQIWHLVSAIEDEQT